MNKKQFNLRKVAAMVACLAVTTVFASCGKNGDDGGNNPSGIVGRWLCVEVNKTCVYFFDKDGTFIRASISLPYYLYVSVVEHCKGNYQVDGETIEFTDMYRYSNDLAGWRDVPQNEIDDVAIAQNVLDIQKIIKTGTRSQVEALINPDNPYYYQKANHGWQTFASRTGTIKFIDAKHIELNIMGAREDCEKVK